MFDTLKNIVARAVLVVFVTAGTVAAQPIPSPSETSTVFNGFSSEITVYDGQQIQCFLPTGGGLNGVLEGIDDKMCELNALISSLSASEEVVAVVDSLDEYISYVETLLQSIQNISIESPDNSVTITSIPLDETIWQLSANIQQIESILLSDIDLMCLQPSDTTMSSIIESLLDMLCEVPQGACSNTYVFSAQIQDEGPTGIYPNGAIVLQLVPSNGGAYNPLECVVSIEYVVEIKNGSGSVLYSEIIPGDIVMNIPTEYVLPYGYSGGARTVDISMTVQSEGCTAGSGILCDAQVSEATYAVIEGYVIPDVVANDDYISINAGLSGSIACHTIAITDNDVVENDEITAINMLSSPAYGSVSVSGIRGRVVYCISIPALLGTYTFDYEIVTAGGERDTATVSINIYSGAAREVPADRVDILTCVSFGYATYPSSQTALYVHGVISAPTGNPVDTGYVILSNPIMGVDTIHLSSGSFSGEYNTASLNTSSGPLTATYNIILSDSTIFEHVAAVSSFGGLENEILQSCSMDENVCNTNFEIQGSGVCLGYSPQEGGTPFTWDIDAPAGYSDKQGVIKITYIEECNGSVSYVFTDTIVSTLGVMSSTNGTASGNIFSGAVTHSSWNPATDSCGGADTSEVALVLFEIDVSATNACGNTVSYRASHNMTVGLAGTLPDPEEDCFDAP